jgi:hypothetical protein
VLTTLKKIHFDPDSVQEIATVLTTQQVNGDFDAIVNGKDFANLLNWQIRNLCPDIHLTVIYSGNPNLTIDPEVYIFHRVDDYFSITIP